MKLIGLEDLPDDFKVYLEDSFRKELISKAVKQVRHSLTRFATRVGFTHKLKSYKLQNYLS